MMLRKSQERMLAILKPGREADGERIFAKWGLDAATIGHTTDTGRLVLKHRGETVCDVPLAPLFDDAPLYDRPWVAPVLHPRLNPADVPAPDDYAEAVLKLMSAPDMASKRWLWEQYDRHVMADTLEDSSTGADAGIVRVHGSKKALAMTSDVTPRYVQNDPYEGGKQAVAEAWRNLTAVGADPIAITDNLNFGNPERPEIMGQFAGCVEGMRAACLALDYPVVSGNVSLYNETEGKAVFPTPMIGMVGLMDDCARNAGSAFSSAGDRVGIVGGLGNGHLGGSEYLRAVHGKVAGMPPPLDFAREKAVQKAVREAVRAGLLNAAHDVSDGGLAVTLAEMCFGKDLGCRLTLRSQVRPDALLFGEDASRVVVSYAPADRDAIEAICKAAGAPFEEIGQVGGNALVVEGALDARLADLKESWSSAIPKIVGEGIHHAALEGVP